MYDDNLTIVEVVYRGPACGGGCCVEQKSHYIIEGNEERVKEVIKEDLLELIDNATFDEDKERLLPKIDEMIEDLVENQEMINLRAEAFTTIDIISSPDWVRFFSEEDKWERKETPEKKSLLDKYKSYKEVSASEKAWITIRAKKAGKNPISVHAGFKAAFTKRYGK